MAVVTLTALYESEVEPELEGQFVEAAFEVLNERSELHHSGMETEIQFQLERYAKGQRLRWSVAESFEVEILRHWDAESASRAIASAVERFESLGADAIESTRARLRGAARTPEARSVLDSQFHPLSGAMRDSLLAGGALQARAAVPLRHGDQHRIGASPMEFVELALQDPHPFSATLRRQVEGMSAKIEDSHLLISGASLDAVGLAAAAFVRAQRPILLARPTVRPYWAYATIAILAASFALSWLPLTSGAIIALGTLTVGAVAADLGLGRREGILGRTALGLVPVLVMIAFAILYAIAGIGGQALGLQDQQLHLRDALLLSLSLASTVGVLDLRVTGWLRSIAYLEMLLVLGYLGTATVVVGRSLSRRLDEALRELRSERTPDEGRVLSDQRPPL